MEYIFKRIEDMNENIKQLIEKEAEKQKKNINWCYFDAYSFDAADDLWDEAFTKGANFILSKWQEAERWRSVEEELPDKDGMYLVTTEKSLYVIAEYLGGFWVLDVKKCGAILRWKPIND